MKQIIKNFNNLVKKTIFKVQNKTNDNFNISTFNKCLITLVASLFVYLFYLLIPILYEKTWVQTNIENKLLKEFKVNLSTSAEISYRILPSPHFLIKDSKILATKIEKKNPIAEIKDLKIFLSQKNLFNKKKMNIREIEIGEANFSLLRKDLKLLDEYISKKFSNKKIKINNSNIFFRDDLEDIISIIKIHKSALFFDEEKLSNIFNLKGEIFNIPFTFSFNNKNDNIKYKEIDLISKSLKLNISNKSTTDKELISGINYISLLKSTINTKYNIKKKLISFKSNNSRLDDSQLNYDGELSINPFDLNFNIYLDNYRISKIFNINPIIIEFIKSGLLFNENISVKTSIIVNSNIKNEIFHYAEINLNIINGGIHFDKTKFINEEIGSLQFNNSNLFYKDNELVFSSDLLVDIIDSENLFSFLNTNKSSRKDLKNISVNIEYSFLSNKIEFKNLKINGENVDNELLTIIDGFNDNNLNNSNMNRRLLNKLLKAYAG